MGTRESRKSPCVLEAEGDGVTGAAQSTVGHSRGLVRLNNPGGALLACMGTPVEWSGWPAMLMSL